MGLLFHRDADLGSGDSRRTGSDVKLIDNWQSVIKRAWSIRLLIVAAVLTGIEAIMPFLQLPKAAIFGLVTAALIARVIAQKDMK